MSTELIHPAEVVPPTEVARMLNRSYEWVRVLTRRGVLSSQNIGGRTFYARKDVESMIADGWRGKRKRDGDPGSQTKRH